MSVPAALLRDVHRYPVGRRHGVPVVGAAELFNGIPGIGGVKDASNYNNTPAVLYRHVLNRSVRSDHRRGFAEQSSTVRCHGGKRPEPDHQ